MIRVRNSEIDKFKRCPRSWYLSYYRNMELDAGQRKTPHNYDIGTAAHVGLRAHYEGKNPKAAIDEHAATTIDGLHPMADLDAWNKAFDKAQAMVEHYPAWLDDEGLDLAEETLSLETEMSLTVSALGDRQDVEVNVYGTPDRVVRPPAGLVIEDWKTVQRVERPFMMESNWQLLNYMLFARAKFPNEPIVGARHRQLVRSLHTGRAKAPQYAEHFVSFSEARVDHHFEELHSVLHRMVEAREVAFNVVPAEVPVAFPPTLINQCTWDCNFHDVCSLMSDGGDWEFILDTNYRKRQEAK